jgi:branched-chain amino acid transport system substrate-binding protein
MKKEGMNMEMIKKKKFTRREFIKKVGKGTAAVGVASVLPRFAKPVKAAKRDHILVGYVNPSTGPIAAFGEPSPWIDERCMDVINQKGGIYIEEYGKKVPVKWKIVDSESSPTKAAELATKLILDDKVDLIVPLHTPDTTVPVSGIAERFKVPCIAIDSPVGDWLTGGPYHWSFMHFWNANDDIFNVFTGMWDQLGTNKVVGGLWPNDMDGVEWARVFNTRGREKGYKVIDPGRFPFFQKDFGSQINMFKKANVEILTGVLIPPDFATAWRQCKRIGFKPKAVTVGKALLFPSAVDALGGDLGEGLTTELWWSPHHPFKSSLTGETSKELCDTWEKETKKQWTPPMGYKHSAWELVYDVLTRAKSVKKEKVRNAIAETQLSTIVGPVKYNRQNYSRTPLVGAQWIKGDKWAWEQKIVYNEEHPYIPKTGTLKSM